MNSKLNVRKKRSNFLWFLWLSLLFGAITGVIISKSEFFGDFPSILTDYLLKHIFGEYGEIPPYLLLVPIFMAFLVSTFLPWVLQLFSRSVNKFRMKLILSGLIVSIASFFGAYWISYFSNQITYLHPISLGISLISVTSVLILIKIIRNNIEK